MVKITITITSTTKRNSLNRRNIDTITLTIIVTTMVIVIRIFPFRIMAYLPWEGICTGFLRDLLLVLVLPTEGLIFMRANFFSWEVWVTLFEREEEKKEKEVDEEENVVEDEKMVQR